MCSRAILNLDQEVGTTDALFLESLTEENFVANLYQRFKRDQIYTYMGNMVVSINPYKRLAIYSAEVVEAYRTRSMYQLPPHIYSVANNAYQSMTARSQDQCLVVSGESGSGKTEVGKYLMHYIVHDDHRHGDSVNSMRNQLLQSNAILEAFGNAKTHRNDNSSRFGKYVDIEFDFKGDPEGGFITNYFLEKSRVTSQFPGERNFHVFYQLLSGAEVQLLKSLKVHRNVNNYNFLKSRSQTESSDDKHNFGIIRKALEVMGFSTDEILSLFQLVACVVKLGNVEFSPRTNIDGTEGCVLVNEYEVDDVCDLLRCQAQSLQSALMQKTVDARLELVIADLTASEATYARDSLCKALYSRLFTWIVGRINESIKIFQSKKHGRRRTMSILDTYGFEVFEDNSFEQLIINYCNEKLQQMFIEHTLKSEQEEYLREGIEWSPVEFSNNCGICDLIERNNHGILSILDEECLRISHTTDETFLHRLDQTCADSPHYESHRCCDHDGKGDVPENCFRIKHYAGRVTYSVSGMLDKNSDLISKDISQAMYQCEHGLMKILFPEGNPKRTTLKRPTTAATQFKIAINALMKSLKSKCPSYIRCIKPNELKQPRIFEMALVQHQVQYLGLMESIRLQRAGFSFHQSYEQFLARYKMLSLNTWPSWRGLPSEGVSRLLKDLPIPASEYAFGRSKVFIRSPTTMFDLEEFRRLRMDELACLIQRTYRGWKQRTRYRQMKTSQTTIAAYWKGYKTREVFKEFRLNHMMQWAAVIIQRSYRHYKKKQFLLHLSANLPSQSPTCRTWLPCPEYLQETSRLIWRMFHEWRCHKFRQTFDQTARNRMREKVTASIIFRDRKASYSRSVSHPFQGDYVRLRHNAQWKKLCLDTNDHYVVFADIINKVTRSGGKCVPILFVLTTSSMLIMDHRTMHIKYRIPVTEIYRLSLSPYLDDVAVFHVRAGELSKHKGDFVFQTCHVIEIVTKIFLVVQNATGKPPQVDIATEFEAVFGTHLVTFIFKSTGLPEVQPGQMKIVRKGNRMEVIL